MDPRTVMELYPALRAVEFSDDATKSRLFGGAS